MKIAIAAVLALVVFVLYCCLVAGSKADDEMERQHREKEPEEGKHG